MRTLFIFFLALFISLLQSANAQKIEFGELIISNAWIRSTPANHHLTAGYLEIENVGDMDDKLIDVSSSIAEEVEIHQIIMKKEIIKMRPLKDGLTIRAGDIVHLKPGSVHLMFLGLKQLILPTELYEINLTFLNAGKLTVMASVKPDPVSAMQHQNEHKH